MTCRVGLFIPTSHCLNAVLDVYLLREREGKKVSAICGGATVCYILYGYMLDMLGRRMGL